MERLCQLAGEVASLRDEHRTLKRIVEAAVEVTGLPMAHVALVDRAHLQLYGVVSSGTHKRSAPRARFTLSPGLASYDALKKRQPILIEDARTDPRVHPEARTIWSIGSVAYFPLLLGRQSFGLLVLHAPKPRRWVASEMHLARHVACFASVALQTSRLLDRLAETDGRFQSLLEDIPAIVYSCEVDFPYRTFTVSPQVETILGTPARQWVEDPDLFFKLIHPDDLPGVLAANEEGKAGRGFVRSEYRLLDRRGATRWFRDEAVLVRDPAGKPIAWHGVLVEITGIKELGTSPPRPGGQPVNPGRPPMITE
ncbi:MAG TPA: PAS domain-containing protein [Candidatus Polarisedimenticolia bacterium]|jgi:PAS domain S-box-containing protein|nr:PAS domain-containing protein [Candidatus Polarisedimenticolia bacterium]